MPKVLNKYRDQSEIGADAVYIGRGSIWGNPFKIGIDGMRDEVIEKYKAWFFENGPADRLEELRGRDLVCFCAPQACHGDFLLELANK